MAALRYLLDTDIVSALVKDPAGALAARIAKLDPDSFCTSIVVAAELRYGACLKDSDKLTQQVATVLEAIEILPLDAPIDQHYGEIRAALARIGRNPAQGPLCTRLPSAASR